VESCVERAPLGRPLFENIIKLGRKLVAETNTLAYIATVLTNDPKDVDHGLCVMKLSPVVIHSLPL
jgi:hypothetical protein